MTPSLPIEIIQLVLDEICVDGSTSVATTLTASSISQHWRTVALSTPALWSTFTFCLRTCQEAMLCAFFERSYPGPLNLTVSLDFVNTSQIEMMEVQYAIALILCQDYRLERLHLRFFAPMHGCGDILGQLLCFESSTLHSLGIESLDDNEAGRMCLINELEAPQPPSFKQRQALPQRCPALTHVRCTYPALLPDGLHNMTHLCITGVPSRRNHFDIHELRCVLQGTKALAELVIDGTSLQQYDGPISIPHLRTLSLRHSPRTDGRICYQDTQETALLLRSLEAPTLVSLAIHEPNEHLPVSLGEWVVRIPSVTRFTVVVPGSWQPLYHYSLVLPAVEKLILLGFDPELGCLLGLSDTWPHLRTIDLAGMVPPPLQCLENFSASLYGYAQRRRDAGYGSRMEVRLPRGILPHVNELIDLRIA